MASDDFLACCPDEGTNTITTAEIAADRTLVRDNFWRLAPEELSNWERFVLKAQLLDYLGTGLDPDWLSPREVGLILELHNHLRAWLDDDRALGEALGPSFRRVT